MQVADIDHCRRRIAEETQLGQTASSAEVAERHHQMAMLYKVQLAVLERQWCGVAEAGRTVGCDAHI